MADFAITARRRELLQAVDDGAVWEKYPILPDPPYSERDRGPGPRLPGECRYRKVTAAISKLQRAGLVELQPRRPGDHYKSSRMWQLTGKGREALGIKHG